MRDGGGAGVLCLSAGRAWARVGLSNYDDFYIPVTPYPLRARGVDFFGLWRVCFPPCLVRPGRRLPVQGLSEGSLGYRDRLPA